MVAKTSILKELETIYEKSGNQLYVLYGRTDSEKEQLLKAFLSNKKYFYYRSRQASEQEQRNQMEAEIRQKFLANITKHSYDEFFNRIKSGDASKLVVVIDEFQLIAKKDASFMEPVVSEEFVLCHVIFFEPFPVVLYVVKHWISLRCKDIQCFTT